MSALAAQERPISYNDGGLGQYWWFVALLAIEKIDEFAKAGDIESIVKLARAFRPTGTYADDYLPIFKAFDALPKNEGGAVTCDLLFAEILDENRYQGLFIKKGNK